MKENREEKLQKAARIIRNIAMQNGVSEETVRRDMEMAIEQGMADPNPAIQKRWRGIPCAGDRPTPEELIVWSAEKLKN